MRLFMRRAHPAYKIEKGYVVRGISRILSLWGGGGGAKGRAENTLSATLAGFVHVYSHGRIQQRAI